MARLIELEALYNVRDLGGTPAADGKAIRTGLLFRGDQPYPATERDKRTLYEAGVRAMVDFRSLAEHERRPDPEIEGVENVYLPIIKDVRAGITHGAKENKRIIEMLMQGDGVDVTAVDFYMGNMYRQFVDDPFANAQYARFVDLVVERAEAGQGVYWHCTAGKDRAGFATVILLSALGVDRDVIVADYLLTNERLKGFTAGMVERLGAQLGSQQAKDALVRFFSADGSFLRAAFDAADARFGSFSAFLAEGLGIDEAKRARLRAALLR